ncbi:hypothetical protein LQF12_02805 [Ruania suaedae]|uniref:hypothetical protein n=1 Tax=Ruania suaedae TaxID=2897774 RepID=UPI001E49BB88|nr:hypothetical protein [Ruania suaedae]UFU03555.1 hypothetical protein LQF12_02805 [Ruania suaedae]
MADLPGPAIPELGVLPALHEAIAVHGAVALGGSGLLRALGIEVAVNDWDLITDADPELVRAAIDGLGLPVRRVGGDSERFATRALFQVCDPGTGRAIDVMVDFAIVSGSEVVAIPVRPLRRWHGLWLADPRDWELAYRLMGRPEKAALLRDWLTASHGTANTA